MTMTPRPQQSYHYPRHRTPRFRFLRAHNELAARGWARCLGCALWIDPQHPEMHAGCVSLSIVAVHDGGPTRAA